MTAVSVSTIDVRTIAPRERHPLIFGQFAWTYLQSGPDLWRVQIDKIAADPTEAFAGSCCSGGACAG